MPSGKKRKRHKMSTHKRKKRLRKNRHKSTSIKNKLVKRLSIVFQVCSLCIVPKHGKCSTCRFPGFDLNY